jgi:UDP-GlcNAc:undecaprenyl-phosphate/decaprenyl-phosphate GlcNAc-1-phosphate transferase
VSFEALGWGVALAFVASLIACRALIATGPRDKPTEERKAHRAPTPTSGGLGIGLGVVVGLALVVAASPSLRADLALVVSVTVLSATLLLIGFVDDTRHLSASLKFVLFCVICLLGAFIAGVVQDLPLTHNLTLRLPLAVGLIGCGLWLFTLINGVNFMDGANGLAMGAMLIGFGALAALAQAVDIPLALAIALAAMAALLGFLVWNFPDGHIFAGDSGALFVAALAGMISLLLITRGGVSPFVPPIVFFPLLADALLTLLWRAQRGRSLLVAHDEHLYQIALRAWPGHWRAALAYWAAMAACGGIAYMVAGDPDPAAPWIALASLAALSIIISAFMRAWAVPRGYLKP